MSVQRINEISIEFGGMFGKKMMAQVGTDKERAFLTSAMVRGQKVVEDLLDLVTSGITYDSWREYFLDVNSNVGGQEYFDEAELAQLQALNEELAGLDLQEYYATIVVPFLNAERLVGDVVEMKRQRTVMEEIWAEEDEENGVAPSKEVA